MFFVRSYYNISISVYNIPYYQIFSGPLWLTTDRLASLIMQWVGERNRGGAWAYLGHFRCSNAVAVAVFPHPSTTSPEECPLTRHGCVVLRSTQRNHLVDDPDPLTKDIRTLLLRQVVLEIEDNGAA